MQIKLAVLLAAAALSLTACSSDNKIESPAASGEAAGEEMSQEQASTRESVFIYNQQKSLPDRIVLGFNCGPILLPSGYARLAGVVSGGNPIACLEIGGRGLALSQGEKADDYRVVRIGGDSVILEK